MTEVTPYLIVDGAAAALEFYLKAFGAVEDSRWTDAGGRIGHAQFTIDGAVFYLADEHPESGIRGPRSLGGSSVSLMLEVPDADAALDRAAAAGAAVDRPAKDEPHGERIGWLVDPFGHRWGIGSRTEEVSEEELRRRVADSYEIT